jgi:manganese transport protein
MGVMGIIADICYEWSKTMIDGGIAPIYFAVFFIALVYFIFWNGRTQFFERCLAVLVAIMALCFLLNFFIMMPPPIDILKGMIPSLPEVSADAGKEPFLVIASMVGTTVFSGLFIIRTTLVKEAGWTIKDIKHQRNDAIVSATMMFVISGSIMAAAAGTLHAEGLVLTEASQMIRLLEPLVGSFATAVFAIGIIAAGVSSQFPNVLMLPWLLCDYKQSERKMTLTRYRMMVLIISLLGLVVPIFHARPVYVMVVSQAFQSIVLPLTVGCILYLGNRKDLMGEYTNKLMTNIFLTVILAFSTTTTYMGISGVCQKIADLIGP